MNKRLFLLMISAALMAAAGCSPSGIPASGVSLSESSVTLETGKSIVVEASVFPDAATDKTVTWLSDKMEVAVVQDGVVRAVSPGTALITATAHNGKSASCTIIVPGKAKNPGSSNANGHLSVDLGLSVIWAVCNVGSDRDYLLGNSFYAWGDIDNALVSKNIGKGRYRLGNKKENGFAYTKYNESDALTRLAPGDDAAAAGMGGDWRMPTAEECRELLENTTAVERTKEGHPVIELTSKRNGYTLVIPLNGYYYSHSSTYDSSHFEYITEQGNFFLFTSDLKEGTVDEAQAMSLGSVGFLPRLALTAIRGVLPK